MCWHLPSAKKHGVSTERVMAGELEYGAVYYSRRYEQKTEDLAATVLEVGVNKNTTGTAPDAPRHVALAQPTPEMGATEIAMLMLCSYDAP